MILSRIDREAADVEGKSAPYDGPELPPQNAETYLGDGLYASFDGFCVILRAPRPHSTDNAAELDHWVGLEPEVYRALREWIARYPRLAAYMESN